MLPINKADECKPVYSFLQMEASLCVWEHLVEGRMQHNLHEPVYKFWDKAGYAEMRLSVTPAIANYALMLHDRIGQDYICEELGWSYDWDFIPFVVGLVRRIYWHDTKHIAVPVFPTLEKAHQMLLSKKIDHMLDDGEE